tara:strand:- start:195 stop:647 length:453 start_codon:yes stop_codon:yes gene_type:complete
MAYTKEEKRAYDKVYREANKEKKALQDKTRYEAKKEEIKIQRKARYEANKEAVKIQLKAYSKTPTGKRSHKIASWKHIGAIGDLKLFYDERYLPATQCEVCEKVFKSNRDKHMDHCHTTGEIRWVLCCRCNSHDHWKKVLARKEEATILY